MPPDEKPKLICFTAKGENSFCQKDLIRLKSVAEMTYIKSTKKIPVIQFLELTKDAEFLAISPRSFPEVNEQSVKKLKSLKGVILPTTGTEWLNVDIFLKNKILVSNTPGYSSVSCAEYTWGLILTVIRKIAVANIEVKKIGKAKSPLIGTELSGKTIGVIGLGSIGKIICKYAEAFEMTVIGWDQRSHKLPGVKRKSLEDLLRESDIISLHLPLTKKTKYILDRSKFRIMKKGCILVNTARPDLVNAKHLKDALKKQRPLQYAFDSGYLDPKQVKTLARNPAIFAVPHVSWYTREAVQREMTVWTDVMIAMIERRPINLIAESP